MAPKLIQGIWECIVVEVGQGGVGAEGVPNATAAIAALQGLRNFVLCLGGPEASLRVLEVYSTLCKPAEPSMA